MTIVDMAAVGAYVGSKLKPMALESARSAAGGTASEAAMMHGGSHVTAAAVDNVAMVKDCCRHLADAWRKHSQCVNYRLQHMVEFSPEAEEPAYLTCLGKETPTEKIMFEVMQCLQRAASHNLEAVSQGTYDAAEEAWVSELDRSYKSTLELFARLLAIVAQARLASHHICLAALAQVVDVLILWANSNCAGFAQREAWMREHVRVHGPGDAQRPIFLCFATPSLAQTMAASPNPAASAGCPMLGGAGSSSSAPPSSCPLPAPPLSAGAAAPQQCLAVS